MLRSIRVSELNDDFDVQMGDGVGKGGGKSAGCLLHNWEQFDSVRTS